MVAVCRFVQCLRLKTLKTLWVSFVYMLLHVDMRHNIVFQWKFWVLEEDCLPKVISLRDPGTKVDKWRMEEVWEAVLTPIPPLNSKEIGSATGYSVGIEVEDEEKPTGKASISASDPTQSKQRKEKSGGKVMRRKVDQLGVRCLPELGKPVLVPVGTVEPAFAGATPLCFGDPATPIGNRSPEVGLEPAGRKAWLEQGPNPLETYKVALIVTLVIISNLVVLRRYKLIWRE